MPWCEYGLLTVTFVLSEEQEELRRVLRGFLADTSPPRRVRELMETAEGYDAAVWRQMAEELGLQGLAVPESHGGLGFGWVELGLVFEEMGRALLCSPFLATVALAAGALRHAGDQSASADLLPGIASGRTVATLAVAEDGGRWDEAGVHLRAARASGGGGAAGSGGWALTGHKSYVVDGHVADLVLVAGRSDAGIGLFAVSGDAPGLVRTPMPTMDLTRKLARLEFRDTPCRLVGVEGEGWPAVRTGLALGAVALAAEQVGGAERCLEMAVDHAKARRQFGRPIGSFQAIKHKCADLLMEVESAKSAAAYATWAADQASPGRVEPGHELLVASSLAKAACGEAFVHAAAENIQIHGALGFTWEHDAHLYLKRAKSGALLLGDATYHRGLLAGHIGL